jgi:UDP-N-acetylmuramoyl-L-alanyl-D-glutamate--2,6-diaminopimelate ligase
MQRKLNEILPSQVTDKLTNSELSNLSEITVTGLHIDSREIGKNGMFFAVPGTQVDGHNYVESAIANGATVIVHEKKIKEEDSVLYLKVNSVQDVVGEIASLFYGEPSKKMKVVGVTGTNGKTSVVTLLHQMMTSLSGKTGLLSTIVNKIGEQDFVATHTTGDSIQIQENLSQMQKSGCTHCFMEVSSHALDQKRTNGIEFAGGVFTNLTQDHLDYHKTMEEYLKAKKVFFDNLSPDSFSLINIDDESALKMVAGTSSKVQTYGQSEDSDYNFTIESVKTNGLSITIQKHPIEIPLVGEFNAYNFTAVYVTLILLGYRHDEIEPKIMSVLGVPGRMQKIFKNSLTGIVDYAHTPDALRNVLETLTKIKAEGRIITIVGCGGDRDKSKRPKMAKIAEKFSDTTILTSDNPRTEDPKKILDDMLKGVVNHHDVLVIQDRREAIAKAVSVGSPGDIILLAGKGHEDYQVVGTKKKHFDDIEELEKAL